MRRLLRWTFTLLVGALLLCSPLTYIYFGWRAEQQLLKAGDYLNPRVRRIGPAWAATLLGRHAYWLDRTDSLILAFAQTGDDFNSLAGFCHLRTLTIWGVKSDERLTDADLQPLAQLASLESLDLESADCTTLSEVAKLSQLQELGLKDLPRLSPGALHSLSSLQQLQQLSLDQVPADDSGMIAVGQMNALREFRVKGADISDAGLAKLGQLKQLNRLDVDGSRVTGSAFRSLTGLTQLAVVILRRSRIDDAGLASIARMPAIQGLEVDGQFSNRGILELVPLTYLPYFSELGVRSPRLTLSVADIEKKLSNVNVDLINEE